MTKQQLKRLEQLRQYMQKGRQVAIECEMSTEVYTNVLAYIILIEDDE